MQILEDVFVMLRLQIQVYPHSIQPTKGFPGFLDRIFLDWKTLDSLKLRELIPYNFVNLYFETNSNDVMHHLSSSIFLA